MLLCRWVRRGKCARTCATISTPLLDAICLMLFCERPSLAATITQGWVLAGAADCTAQDLVWAQMAFNLTECMVVVLPLRDESRAETEPENARTTS